MAQEEDSCVVFGMPQAAKQLGATMNMFSLEAIIAALIEIGECPDGQRAGT
jgi:chemotaxis response regulator CheB